MSAPLARLRIQETFVSVQGEGGRVGIPSRFIRVAGCNLRCTWCDSPDSSWQVSADTSAWHSLEALAQLCAAGPRDVVLTGGEPLLFPALAQLSQALHRAGHTITVESAGTVWLEGLHCDLMSISPKLAHSTPHQRDPLWVQRHEQARWAPEVVSRLMTEFANWQLKFVVRWREARTLDEDLSQIELMLSQLGVDGTQACRVLLMPECTDPRDLPLAYAALMPECIARGFRLGERLHIHIFGHRPGT